MAGAGVEVGLGVVLWSLVLVADEESDGRAECDTMLYARLEVHEVLLVSLAAQRIGVVRSKGAGLRECGHAHRSGQVALSGSPSAQLDLDVLCGEGQTLVLLARE